MYRALERAMTHRPVSVSNAYRISLSGIFPYGTTGPSSLSTTVSSSTVSSATRPCPIGVAPTRDGYAVVFILNSQDITGQFLENRAFQVFEALACDRGDLQHFETTFLAPSCEFLNFLGIGDIHLRCDNDLWLFRQIRIVFSELAVDGVNFIDWIALIRPRHIHQMKQQASAFDVP